MKSIRREQAKNYGKYAATAVVGIGVGLAGYTVNDTPTQQTDTYQNLQDKLDDVQNDNSNLQEQLSDLNTTVTEKEDKVANLEAQVTQFNQTVEDLRAENADLEDAVAQAEERVGLVDYLPVFSDDSVDMDDSKNIAVEINLDASNYDGITTAEGDYDQLDVDYTSDDGNYDVTITQFEETEDADEAVENFDEAQTPVEFSADGDEHTVTVNDYEGSMDKIEFDYTDEDAVKDVDHEDDIESVVVDGEDITEHVGSVSHENGDDEVRVNFDETYYVNDGDSIKVTYSDAEDDGELEKVQIYDEGADDWEHSDYDTDDDQTREDIYRDGDTVIEVTGTDTGDKFEAQYADLQSHYE